MNRLFILIRHSLPDMKQGLPAREWMLSKEGKERAERMAESLTSYGFDFLASSHEPKALETAQIVAAKFGIAPQVIEGLHEHERRTTPYLSRTEFEASIREFFEKPDTLVFGNETANQAHERFSRAIYTLLSEHDNSKIGIISHGTVISLFVTRLTGQPGFKIWSELGLPCFMVLDMHSKNLIAFENFS